MPCDFVDHSVEHFLAYAAPLAKINGRIHIQRLAIASAVSPLIAAGGGYTLKYIATTTYNHNAAFHPAKSLENQ